MRLMILPAATAATALGLFLGMATAGLHSLVNMPVEPAVSECGTPGEDPIRCSREGAQAVSLLLAGEYRGSGRVIADATSPDCPRGSRDCFPKDRVGLL